MNFHGKQILKLVIIALSAKLYSAFTSPGVQCGRRFGPLYLSSASEQPLSVKKIREELKNRGVSFADCFDKESLLQRLNEARKNETVADHSKAAIDELQPVTGNDESTTEPIQKEIPSDTSVLEETRSMSVRELREELGRRNLRWAGLLEKEDLVRAVYQARMKAADFSVTGLIAPGDVGELTGEQLELELSESEVPLLLDAYAVWCGPCKMMAPELKEAAKILGDRVRVAKMDTDKHPKQAANMRIQGLPTLILFKNGKEQDRIEGALMKDQLLQWVDSKL
mmetsp:Transcript_15519/g.20207  ORF Transcript_15519/g.20207 Transcript_15519/m.20207 type:complete len:282 (+) Transcript_15519:100-945(+)|eukprot:CAMPEP_0198152104 /NCGR_PEP_ID=MMETSP1443-20131203/58504_1 /TAXON_ID=186043 /ORGANISM="Entomoneis sp., Strain CCMP2396" /LENGTH=281 /DNA_ID=CAMNT_0043818015 /DNA_START=56 /DNA_END=901 /DNA_ORIENTATION=+